MKEFNIPLNNGRYMFVEQSKDEIVIHTVAANGAFERDLRISGGDFVSMLNWYNYQKENGNPHLLF